MHDLISEMIDLLLIKPEPNFLQNGFCYLLANGAFDLAFADLSRWRKANMIKFNP